ncbi:MAG TPA: DNA-processing protein DprA [Vicinamibacterales bacterium]|jgi:DNA processing protein|nr:DNA-processing protein DprA [Vicinamibacterales bacterium]
MTASRASAYSPPPSKGIYTTTLAELMAASITLAPEAPRQADLFQDEDEDRSTRLYCAGDRSLIERPRVAIIGTRDPSSAGAGRARRLARELAGAGVVVVSGLAKGIDTEALAAAIEAAGRVIAVIGTPLDRAYPGENKRLQERIYHEHLLISQFAPGQRVFQRNFPVRNRLMAALSDATVIVEAGESSGTFHQAVACERLGRWLFIARTVADDPHLRWPADFIGKPRVRVLNATTDILTELPPPRQIR